MVIETKKLATILLFSSMLCGINPVTAQAQQTSNLTVKYQNDVTLTELQKEVKKASDLWIEKMLLSN